MELDFLLWTGPQWGNYTWPISFSCCEIEFWSLCGSLHFCALWFQSKIVRRIVPRNARSSDGVRHFPLKGISLRLLCVAINDADSPNSNLVFFGSLQSHEDYSDQSRENWSFTVFRYGFTKFRWYFFLFFWNSIRWLENWQNLIAQLRLSSENDAIEIHQDLTHWNLADKKIWDRLIF